MADIGQKVVDRRNFALGTGMRSPVRVTGMNKLSFRIRRGEIRGNMRIGKYLNI